MTDVEIIAVCLVLAVGVCLFRERRRERSEEQARQRAHGLIEANARFLRDLYAPRYSPRVVESECGFTVRAANEVEAAEIVYQKYLTLPYTRST